MDVTGLDMLQISKLMETCLAEHFAGHSIISDSNGIFQEVILLAFDEIEHLLVQPVGERLFNNGDWFFGASGFIELCNNSDGSTENYTVMLVMNTDHDRLFYLYASKRDAAGNEVNILIKDFTQNSVV